MFPRDKRPPLPFPLQMTIWLLSHVVLLASDEVIITARAANEVKCIFMVIEGKGF
jgi:hypothetical protein